MDLKEALLLNEYTVDWGKPFGEKTVYIKTPMRFEDFGEEEKAMLLTKNYIRDHITLTVNQDDYAMVYRLKAAFQVSKTEPELKVSAIVQMINPDADSRQIQYTKEKLADILIHKVQTYYKVQEYKEEKNVCNTIQALADISYDITVDTVAYDEKKTVTIRMPYDNLRYLIVTNENKEEKKMAGLTGLMYCDEICEYLGIQKKTPDNKPKWIEGLPAVKKVETYNNRVVKVTFVDGTFTKAVCSENDIFDLDVGITVCGMKRLLGTNSDNATREYNRFIDSVHSVMEKNALEELAEEAKKAKEKSKKRKAELKRAARKLKAREEQIDIQKQAILRAQKELEAMEQ